MLKQERQRSTAAIEETKKAKVCLGELERQLASLQHQLRRSGVKQEHIHAALTNSGLVRLMKVNRVGVFERLYHDAVERMIKMDKIRVKVHEIEEKNFVRKMQGAVQPTLSLFGLSGKEKLVSSPRFNHFHHGSGYQPHHWNGPIMTSFSKWRNKSHNEDGQNDDFRPERYLSAHSVSPLAKQALKLSHRKAI